MLVTQRRTPVYNIENLLRKDDLRLIESDLNIHNQELELNSSNIAIVFPNSYPEAFVYFEKLLQITASDRITFLFLHFYDPVTLVYLQNILQNANSNTNELLPIASFFLSVAKYLGTSARWHTNVIHDVAQLLRETHSVELTFLWETARKRTLTNLVVVAQTEGNCRLQHSQVCWNEKLTLLVQRKAYLAAENLFCSTIGAAYASMTRDKLNASHAEKAKEFAERQMSIGIRLNDDKLIRRAKVYIAYYYIFKRQKREAFELLNEQLECKDPEVTKLAEAALFRLGQLDI